MHDDVYQMYLEEMKEIAACTAEEEALLLKQLREGNQEARKRLLEGMLSYVVELAGNYRDRGLSAGDLVQEANIALIMAAEQYEGGDFREQVKQQVEQALEAALELQQHEKSAQEELLARINVLQLVSKKMAEELGREASVAELAEKMKMTEDEIQDILKETLNAMSVSPDAEI